MLLGGLLVGISPVFFQKNEHCPVTYFSKFLMCRTSLKKLNLIGNGRLHFSIVSSNDTKHRSATFFIRWARINFTFFPRAEVVNQHCLVTCNFLVCKYETGRMAL